jgi:hypothetical protein
MTDQQGWGQPQQPYRRPPWQQPAQQPSEAPPRQQQPPWEQGQQPYGGPQHYPGQPQQPGSGYGTATPPPGYQQPPPGYGYQPPQQGYPSGPPPGHRPPRKRHRVRNVLLGVAGAIVLIIVIASVASSGNGVQKTGSPPAANAATTAPSRPSPSQPENNTTGPVGTTFTVTDTNQNGATVKYSVTLDKVIQHAHADNSFDTAPAGDHLAAAEFTIKGLVGDDQDDANNDASAVGNDNQTYQTGMEGVDAGTNFTSGVFNTSPGSASIGWVSFEVKDGVTVSSIQWSPDSNMGGDSATWTVSG